MNSVEHLLLIEVPSYIAKPTKKDDLNARIKKLNGIRSKALVNVYSNLDYQINTIKKEQIRPDL